MAIDTNTTLQETLRVARRKAAKAKKAYNRWMETGKGDEEVLAENDWLYASLVEKIESVIDQIKYLNE